jgi:hypothetical protein
VRALLVVGLVACGGSTAKVAPPAKPVVATPPAVDPPCPTEAKFTLADGKLRCRELPLVIDFPANTELERADSQNLTFMRATLERGVLALFLEPRFDTGADDAAGMRKRLEALVTGIASDAVITDATAPPQPGATASTALAFTTPDGGSGLVHAYLAHGWFVAVIAGGRKADTPARPDKPIGQAFLASLKLRAPPATWEVRDVLGGVKLELPLAAWFQLTEEPNAKLWAAVGERAWIGARELQASPQCGLFSGVTDADVPGVVKKMFGRDDLEVTGKLVKIGTQAMYATLETPGGTLVLYLICADPRVVLVTVVGKRPAAELDAVLDRVTSTFTR